MDESDVDICQASNNSDVLKEENEDFTNELESGSGTDVDQHGANDFESTRPISAVSGTTGLEDSYLKSNSNEEVIDDTKAENNEECSRVSEHFPDEFLLVEGVSTSGLHSNPEQNSTSSFLNDATVPDDSLEDDQSIDNVFEAQKTSSEADPSAAVQDFPKCSSPIVGSDQGFDKSSVEDIYADLLRELQISQNNSGKSSADSSRISDDELSNISFPEVPSNDPAEEFVDRSSIDGRSGSVSLTSSHTRSYLYSTVSVGEDIPNFLQDDGDHLIPKFKYNGRGFCWPIDKLPLSGDRKFEEGAQWKICDDDSEPIGYGASGQCFIGHPMGKENDLFCVKKCNYKEEEVKALCLAAKEIFAKKISEGAKKIVSFYGATYYKPDVCIFMEYMEGGTVFDAIKEAKLQYKDGLDKSDCVTFVKDVLLALEFIHRKGIVHNDVKADNVLLTPLKLEAKLCDFGKAAAISQHNPASKDIWTAGCFLLEMLGKKYSDALIMSGILKKNDVLKRLPKDVDPDTYEVLRVCFLEDREQCTAKYVLTSTFFKNN